MKPSVFVFDPTATDMQSKARGIGRYLQILKENFPDWTFTNDLSNFQTFKPSNSVFINPFFNFLQTPLVMKRITHKQIAVIHDLIPLKYPDHFPIGIRGKLNVFLNKLSLKNYDRIITDSEASKKDIVEILKIPENKIRVIYPCLPKIFTNSKLQTLNSKQIQNSKSKISTDSNRFQPIPTDSYCLYVGDATWNKNLVNLAKAIKILNVNCVFVGKIFKKNSNFKFQISNLSHPWQLEFKQFLNETENDKRFIFEGFVPDGDLIKLYQQTRVNILPSRDEGFGFSYLEAASQKCPSVLSDIPVLREISAGNALFANPHNPQELAKKIGEIYFNKTVRQTFGQKAFEQSEKFSSNIFKKQFLGIIQQ